MGNLIQKKQQVVISDEESEESEGSTESQEDGPSKVAFF